MTKRQKKIKNKKKHSNKTGYPDPTRIKINIRIPDTRFNPGLNWVAFLRSEKPNFRIFRSGSTQYPVLNTPSLEIL